MTSPPDPGDLGATIAALASQVAALRASLSLINQRADGLSADLELAGIELGARIDTVAADLAAAINAGNVGNVGNIPAPRWDLDQATYDAQLALLSQWVTDVLRTGYPAYTLADCWAAHPDAVIELGNMWAQWTLIYGRARPSLPMALDFHDRWLPNAIKRIGTVTSKCRAGECTMSRRRPQW